MSAIPSTSQEIGEPVWGLAHLFPYQGGWTEADYLALDTNHLIEFTDGRLEVLEMPTPSHQMIVAFLFKSLEAFVEKGSSGTVFFASLPVRMRSGMFREPDLMYVERKHFKWIGEKYLSGSDLVMEVVSPDPASVDRDYEKKRVDFAEGKIREYWIVDPQDKRVTVLTLDEKKYRVHGEFIVGEQATSILLDGFAVNVADVFAAATLS